MGTLAEDTHATLKGQGWRAEIMVQHDLGMLTTYTMQKPNQICPTMMATLACPDGRVFMTAALAVHVGKTKDRNVVMTFFEALEIEHKKSQS